MNAQFLAIARDPSTIPGVHHYCDEWCDYCPVTARCLAFRCTAEFRRRHRRRQGDATFASIEEAVAFTREVSALDGSSTGELDAILANPPGESGLETADPLASVAWDYAVSAAFLFTLQSMTVAHRPRRSSGPAPEQVVLWHHLRIYMKVVRALISGERARGGDGASEDANGCVRLVLVSVERSRAALTTLRSSANAPEVDHLIEGLHELERGLEQRFPRGRGYLRVGIDCPVT